MNTKAQTKDRLSAALLAYFFGSFGLHKFYLGQKGMGITYLAITFLSIFFLAPIIGVISFVEGVRYLIMSDEDFNKQFNISRKAIPASTQLNKHVYSLLALSLGITGLHKFYVRNVKQGLLYLTFGLLLPIVVFLPVLIAGITMLIIAGEDGSSGLVAIGFTMYIVGYLLMIGSILLTQFVAMIEGVITLFHSEEKFDQNHKV
jgi:TM2 domain-containing membrane protein YozV